MQFKTNLRPLHRYYPNLKIHSLTFASITAILSDYCPLLLRYSRRMRICLLVVMHLILFGFVDATTCVVF
jgi:hypothetical protein